MRRSFALLLAFIAALSVPALRAQTPDVRLSFDRLEPTLPASIRIETAAAIGDLVLVVWGTTVTGPASAEPVLVAQRIRSGALVGAPVQVTIERARPGGMVSVATLGDRFVVAWNDDRSAEPAVYSVTIDTAGALGEEQLIASGTILAPGGIVGIDSRGTRVLLWSDSSRSSVSMRFMDSSGRYDAETRRVGDGAPIRFIPLQDDVIIGLIDCGDRPPIFIDRIGASVPMSPEITGRFDSTYWIDDRGRLVTTGRDSIRLYDSPLDSTPSRVVRVPPSVWNGSHLAMLDSIRRIVLYSGEVRSSGFNGYLSVDALLLRAVEQDGGLFSTPEIVALDYTIWAFTKGSGRGGRGPTAVVRRTCGGAHMINLDVQYSLPQSSDTVTVPFNVDGMVVDRWASVTCRPRSRFSLRRILSADSSTVVLAHAGRFLSMAVPVGLATTDTRDGAPAVFAGSDGGLRVVWMATGTRRHAMLARWHADSLTMISERRVGSEPWELPKVNAERIDSIHAGTGFGLLGSEIRWFDTLADRSIKNRSIWSVAVAVDTGWRDVDVVDRITYWRWYRFLAASLNPTDGLLAIVSAEIADNSSFDGARITAVDGRGDVVWRVDSLRIPLQPPGFGIRARRDTTYDIMLTRWLIGCRGDSVVRSLPLVFIPEYPILQPLHSDRAFCWGRSSSRLYLETIDLRDASIQGIAALPAPSPWWDRFVARHPETGLMAIVVGGPNGIQLSVFDSTGREIIPQRRIGSSPDSAYRPHCHIGRDSIWVVWQDARRGELDVYGTIVPLGGIASVGNRAERHPALELIPNPATDLLRIEGSGRGEATMIDLLGNVVKRMTVGSDGESIDVRDLRAGIYVVRLRTDVDITAGTVRILR